MKIIDKRENKVVYFNSLKEGDIFSYDEQIWVKIRQISLDAGHNFVNVVSLYDYSLDFLRGMKKSFYLMENLL